MEQLEKRRAEASVAVMSAIPDASRAPTSRSLCRGRRCGRFGRGGRAPSRRSLQWIGRPTVVILHGWIEEPGITSHDYYGPLTDNLREDFRVCDYDRTNVGDSERLPGPQTPEMVVGDLDGAWKRSATPAPTCSSGNRPEAWSPRRTPSPTRTRWPGS